MSDERDPLQAFPVWEGQLLGDEVRRQPGFRGFVKAPDTHVHLAGAWAMSSMRVDRKGIVHPGVYFRMNRRGSGDGPQVSRRRWVRGRGHRA